MSNTTTKEIFDAGIEMTKKAADRLAAVMEGEGKKGFGLRMEVTTGGCSGLNYNTVSYTHLTLPTSDLV